MRPPPPESPPPPPLEYPPLDAPEDEDPEDDDPDDELGLGLELELESAVPRLPALRTPRVEPGVRLVGVALSPVPVPDCSMIRPALPSCIHAR